MPIGKVWMIYRLLFVCLFVLCVCTVTDFYGEDKASGGGSSASWAGSLPFWGTLLPKKPKIGIFLISLLPLTSSNESASHREVKFRA